MRCTFLGHLLCFAFKEALNISNVSIDSSTADLGISHIKIWPFSYLSVGKRD